MSIAACSRDGESARLPAADLYAADAAGSAATAAEAAAQAADASFAAGAPGEEHRAVATLAYEHEVSVALPAAQIPARLKQLQDGCLKSSFGACTVLQVEQRGGERPRGELSVRIAPSGVEPLIAQAGQDGQIESRTTHAEDLAQAVQDNDAQRQRLQAEQRRLQEFQQRRDLSVADMIALSEKLAAVETQLLATSQEAAQQRRRLDTQRVTLTFTAPTAERSRSDIGDALRDSGEIFAGSIAWAIRAVVGLAPFVLLGYALWRLIAWRRRRRRSA
ncbi:DUF4349 domain-containing protein [Xanthomonas sp. PPL568]|uniref:DUF4349 domain-containing protein n=1 Tax=Xanthomonas indica TaxID=2912242 RepID=UPI001F5A7415|nr:DUF4349 domain-containing protein [Xanthomonas indica]MCI2243486.1 DUF4349 domain-containing protein [Xanthomonas indica]